jgi:hypothetical protein
LQGALLGNRALNHREVEAGTVACGWLLPARPLGRWGHAFEAPPGAARSEALADEFGRRRCRSGGTQFDDLSRFLPHLSGRAANGIEA